MPSSVSFVVAFVVLGRYGSRLVAGLRRRTVVGRRVYGLFVVAAPWERVVDGLDNGTSRGRRSFWPFHLVREWMW